jgi:ammonia channel protein AmtB
VLTSSALVLLMTAPGLALFYAGMVRRKNVLATLMHSFILAALISVQWALWGYSLAFSPWNALIGACSGPAFTESALRKHTRRMQPRFRIRLTWYSNACSRLLLPR